jgi:hypothetical protein
MEGRQLGSPAYHGFCSMIFGQFLTFQRDKVATQERKSKGNFSGRKMATIHQKVA